MADSNVITFRLTADALARLDELSALHGLSRGETARSILVQGLFDGQETVLRELREHLVNDLNRLHANLRLATAAVLADGGHASASEAEEFVNRYFL